MHSYVSMKIFVPAECSEGYWVLAHRVWSSKLKNVCLLECRASGAANSQHTPLHCEKSGKKCFPEQTLTGYHRNQCNRGEMQMNAKWIPADPGQGFQTKFLKNLLFSYISSSFKSSTVKSSARADLSQLNCQPQVLTRGACKQAIVCSPVAAALSIRSRFTIDFQKGER